MGGRESFCLRDLYREGGISVENENERSSNEREWTRGDEEEINFLAGREELFARGGSCWRYLHRQWEIKN